MSYTIDLTEEPGVSPQGAYWYWRLYDQGGSRLLEHGEADSIESAGAEAQRVMLVHHRSETS